jgi:hypothetical protein
MRARRALGAALLLAAACQDREALLATPAGAAGVAGVGGAAGQGGSGQAGVSGGSGQAGAGQAGSAGEPAWVACQDSDEALVQRAAVALLGHRLGYDEARLMVDLVREAERVAPGATPRSGRRALVDALVLRQKGADFSARWADTLADFFRVPRVDEMSNGKCFGLSLRAEGPDLAALVRDTPAWPAASDEPFTMRDLFLSALRLDDLSPVAVAQSMAMLNRSFVGANADPEALELARRASFGSWFSGVFLRRDVVCLGCHNGEFSVAYSDNPEKNHHFPIRTDLERSLFGDPTGPASLGGFDGAARLAAPFRFAGFAVSSLTVLPENAVKPWGWAKECGAFAPPGKVDQALAPVDAMLGAVQGPATSGWDVTASLQRGLKGLREHGLAVSPQGLAVNPDESLAYLASLSLVEAIWTETTGGRLTVAHGFSRNAAARDRLQSLTEGFLASGFSLRWLLAGIIDDPIFNPLPPSAGCGGGPAPWPPVLDPWTVANDDPAQRGNGPGDLVAPIPARALVHGAYTVLGWDTLPQAQALFFTTAAMQEDREFLVDIGTFQKNPEPGFRGFDAQAALAWELRFGRCPRPAALAGSPDAIDRIIAAAQTTPDATLGDALLALKDRLTAERQIDPDDERTFVEILTEKPMATPISALGVDELNNMLRLFCGVLLASPQFRLSGLDQPAGPAPRIQAFDGYDDLCQSLAGQPLAGLPVTCQPGVVRLGELPSRLPLVGRGRRREGRVDRVGQGHDDQQHHAVDDVDLLDLDADGVGFQGDVDVLADKIDQVRLLHGDDIVGLDGLIGGLLAQLLVELERLHGRLHLFLGHLSYALAKGVVERHPDGQRQEVAQRQRGLPHRPGQRRGHPGRERWLAGFKQGEGLGKGVSCTPLRDGQALLNVLERLFGHPRIRRHWADGCSADPHTKNGSPARADRPKGRQGLGQNHTQCREKSRVARKARSRSRVISLGNAAVRLR